MLPWVECPSLNLRLDVSPVDRIAMIPDAVVQRSRELLAAVQAEIPGGKQWLADVVHLSSVNCSIALTSIYRDVLFPNS